MSLTSTLATRRTELRGRVITSAEADSLATAIPLPMDWLIAIMREYPLIGCEFSLDPALDQSDLGVDLVWMTPDDIVAESSEFYPGIAAIKAGYVPVGTCLLGSGDPYFINPSPDDPPLVRILHDYLEPDMTLRGDAIEVVSPMLSKFFQDAQIKRSKGKEK